MTISRRRFVEWAAAVSALSASEPVRSRLAAAAIDDCAAGFRPDLLPTEKAVWDASRSANYLLACAADGGIDKLSPELMHSQIEVFASLLHTIEGMDRATLKGTA